MITEQFLRRFLRVQTMLSTTKGNETIAIECKLEIDGYEENGYNGTGAFVSTSKNLCIEKVESWNLNGDDTENDFNEDELMSWVA